MFKLIILLFGLLPLSSLAELRDPTQPAYQSKSTDTIDSPPPLVLSAIFIFPRSKRATINGVSVKSGESIDIGARSNLAQKQPTAEVDDQATENNSMAASIDSLSTTTNPLNPVLAPSASYLIKIIGIHKNSVTIEHNQNLITLQLVQRSYK